MQLNKTEPPERIQIKKNTDQNNEMNNHTVIVHIIFICYVKKF